MNIVIHNKSESQLNNEYINVQWKNILKQNVEIVGNPITNGSRIIGVITSVDKNYIYGALFISELSDFELNNVRMVSF